MDQCLLSIVKEDNPWDVSSLYDFNYYCCPECDSKSQNKQDFINHASNNHPWVSFSYFQFFDTIGLTNLSNARYCTPCICYYPKYILQT